MPQDLDAQYGLALTNGIPVSFATVGNQTTDGVNGIIDLAHFLLAKPILPTVVSFAIGGNENTLTKAMAT